MGLVFESHEEKLRLTGVPVRLVAPAGDESGALICNSLIVSNDRKIIATESNIKIPLTEQWYKALATKEPGRDDRVILSLSKSAPSNEVDRTLFAILSQTGNSLYDIDHIEVQPKSVLILG
jgi:hypothetical protein